MKNKMNNKMKKSYIIIVLLAILAVALLAPGAGFAFSNMTMSRADLARVPDGMSLPRFIDDVGVVTQEQAWAIVERLDYISERYQFDTVIAVIYELDWREARLYAIDFFEENGFGYGPDLDGIILLQAVEDRDFGFATLGYGLYVFTDDGQEYLESLFLPHLRNDDYYRAYMAFADGVEDFLIQADAGVPYDKGNIPVSAGDRGAAVAVSLIVAFIIALIVVLVWKAQLKSVRKQKYAAAYIRDGSMAVTDMRDIFLYKNTTRTQRAESNSGSGSSGSFSSSSGRSSSGRSGKY